MTKVVVNGTFDLFHLGHLELLKYAKSFPNTYLLVLLDTDDRIKKLKGIDRPINDQKERVELISTLRIVDEAKLFDSDQELETLIKEFAPDIMVKGGDYRNKPIIGSQYCKKIEFFERYGNYSTTKKIQDIISRR